MLTPNLTKAFVIINYLKHILRIYSCNITWTAKADQSGLLTFCCCCFFFYEIGLCLAGYSHKHPPPNYLGLKLKPAEHFPREYGKVKLCHSSGCSHGDEKSRGLAEGALRCMAVVGLWVCRDRWDFKWGNRMGRSSRGHLAGGDRWRLSLGNAGGGVIVAKWVSSTAHRCDHAVPELEVARRWMANIKFSSSKQESTIFSTSTGSFQGQPSDYTRIYAPFF